MYWIWVNSNLKAKMFGFRLKFFSILQWINGFKNPLGYLPPFFLVYRLEPNLMPELTIYFQKPADWADTIHIHYWDAQPGGRTSAWLGVYQ